MATRRDPDVGPVVVMIADVGPVVVAADDDGKAPTATDEWKEDVISCDNNRSCCVIGCVFTFDVCFADSSSSPSSEISLDDDAVEAEDDEDDEDEDELPVFTSR